MPVCLRYKENWVIGQTSTVPDITVEMMFQAIFDRVGHVLQIGGDNLQKAEMELAGLRETVAVQQEEIERLRTTLAESINAREAVQQQLGGETEQRQMVEAREADALQKVEQAAAQHEKNKEQQKTSSDKLHVAISTQSAIQADMKTLQARYKQLRSEKLALDLLLVQVTQSLGEASEYLYHLSPPAADARPEDKPTPKTPPGGT